MAWWKRRIRAPEGSGLWSSKFRTSNPEPTGLQGLLFAMTLLGRPSACEEFLNSAKQHGHVINTCQSGLGFSLGFRALSLGLRVKGLGCWVARVLDGRTTASRAPAQHVF